MVQTFAPSNLTQVSLNLNLLNKSFATDMEEHKYITQYIMVWWTGFKEGKTACCGTGKFRGIFSCGGIRPITKEYELCEHVDDYVFWDSNHPTEKLYKEIADEMWNYHAYGSYSVSDLFYFPWSSGVFAYDLSVWVMVVKYDFMLTKLNEARYIK